MEEVSNNDLATEVKRQAKGLENTKAELTTRMVTLETMMQQLMGTVENLFLDIQ